MNPRFGAKLKARLWMNGMQNTGLVYVSRPVRTSDYFLLTNGSQITNVVPLPSFDSTSIRPA